jgi:hypothetical protein
MATSPTGGTVGYTYHFLPPIRHGSLILRAAACPRDSPGTILVCSLPLR